MHGKWLWLCWVAIGLLPIGARADILFSGLGGVRPGY
jgi:hypothetical protein